MANTKIPVELSSTPGIVDNSNATAITINSDENVGIGTSTIDTTYSGYVGLELGAQAVINGNRTTGDTGVTSIGQNAYLSSASGGSWKYKESGKAALIQGVDDGSIRFLTTDTTGSADDALTWSERGRFLSSGGLTFNGDTATANALDDYEEGTWTPATYQGTVTVATGTAVYHKIGGLVIASCRINSFSDASSSDHIRISGLPYRIKSPSDVNCGYAWSNAATVYFYGGAVETQAYLYFEGSSGYQDVKYNEHTTSTQYLCLFTYFTDQ
tara:strand:+ start:526 stop:1335 length:810 start_codon:yes stop_codon:yes gene_type:complete